MKLSLSPLRHVASLAALALVACDVHVPDPISTPSTETPAEAPVVPTRRLVAGAAQPTSAVNLLTDPGFSLLGQEAGFGSFLAFFAGSFASYTPDVAIDTTSPAGFGGAVAYIRPPRASDTKSDEIVLLTSFPGGRGPFAVEIWASKATARGAPADMPTDGSALQVTVASGSPEASGFDLLPDFEDVRTAGGRTWVRHHGEVRTPLTGGAFFVITTGKAGGHVLLAAPSVTSAEVTAGGELKAARPAELGLRPRSLSAREREAIARYRAVPPRLSAPPASAPWAKPRPGL